jgi:peroxiredoxin
VKVIKHQQRLADAGATAVFVAHDDAEALSNSMLAGVSCPFPVLVDADRTSYRDWRLQRASFAGVWLDPNVWRQYARLLRSGERIRTLGRDTRQLGGDFIIDPQGVIVYARPQQRDDRPPVGRLLAAIEKGTTAS